MPAGRSFDFSAAPYRHRHGRLGGRGDPGKSPLILSFSPRGEGRLNYPQRMFERLSPLGERDRVGGGFRRLSSQPALAAVAIQATAQIRVASNT